MSLDIITFPAPQRKIIVIRCPIFKWPFQCPLEQQSRVMCRACQSKDYDEHGKD